MHILPVAAGIFTDSHPFDPELLHCGGIFLPNERLKRFAIDAVIPTTDIVYGYERGECGCNIKSQSKQRGTQLMKITETMGSFYT